MDEGNSDTPEMTTQNSNSSALSEKTQGRQKDALDITNDQINAGEKEKAVNCLERERSQSVQKENLIEENIAHNKVCNLNLQDEKAQSRDAGGLDSEEQMAQEDLNSLEHKNKDAGERVAPGGMVDTVAADYPEEVEDELEEDDPDGIKKKVQKGYKAVKELFKRSEEKGKGDNHQQSVPRPVPCSDDADVYNFTHHKRGQAIIINNEKFHPSSQFESRPGSEKDASALKEVFKKLGFDVHLYENLTAFEMKNAIEREAKVCDHHNADCLAVAILSHGDSHVQEKSGDYYYQKAHPFADKVRRDLIFGVDGQYISTASIMRTFQDERCPGLVGKPRLFFLQACRGGDYDDGVSVAVVRGDDKMDGEKEMFEDDEETDSRGAFLPFKRNITAPAPIFKDYLVMYATTPGHFAWRRPSGTWFVQSLHTVLTKQLTPHMSLTQALTRVARMVAQGYESNSNTPSMSRKKQTPVIESMLVKDIFFGKK